MIYIESLSIMEYNKCIVIGCKVIVVLGHTNCGAVGATIGGGAEGFMKVLTDEIKKAIGDEKDDYIECGFNVQYGVDRINEVLKDNEEVNLDEVDVLGAIYSIKSGNVEWIPWIIIGKRTMNCR